MSVATSEECERRERDIGECNARLANLSAGEPGAGDEARRIFAQSTNLQLAPDQTIFMNVGVGLVAGSEEKVRMAPGAGTYGKLRCQADQVAPGSAVIVTLGKGDCTGSLTYAAKSPRVELTAPHEPFQDDVHVAEVGEKECVAYQLTAKGSMKDTLVTCSLLPL